MRWFHRRSDPPHRNGSGPLFLFQFGIHSTFLWAATAAFALLIFVSSHQPGSSDFGLPFPHADKIVHAVVYSVLWWLTASAWGGGFCPRGRTYRFRGVLRSAGWPVVWVSLYGITDEIHQSFVPGRTADVWDWVADTSGALVCACLFAVFLRKGAVS